MPCAASTSSVSSTRVRGRQTMHRVARQRGEGAEHHRPARADEAARGRDHHAADDDRRGRADRRDLPAADEVEHEPDDQRAGRAEQRVGEREHARVARREAAAAVEAEPAEPQQARAEQDVDGVVGQERLAPVVLARARPRAPRPGPRSPSPSRPARRRRSRASRSRSASRRRRPSARAPRRRSTDHSAAKTRNAPKRIRSTTAPDTSATVMMQNVAWKAMNRRCGIVVPVARLEGHVVEERVAEAADEPVAPSKASE